MNNTLWQYYVEMAAGITDRALEEVTSLEQRQQQRARLSWDMERGRAMGRIRAR